MDNEFLAAEVVNDLVQRAQGGDLTARDVLVEHFTPLLQATAARYGRRNAEDALQEAALAFLGAIQRFNPDLAIPFPGYAKARVRGEVRTAMRRQWRHDKRCLHSHSGDNGGLGTALWDQVFSARPVSMGLDGQAGTDAAGTHRNPGDRRELRLDPLAGGGDDGRRGYGAVEVAEWLAGTPLSPRERLAILGLMDGWTVSEIAQATGVSTETVKTWRKRGLQKLRQTL